MDDESIKKDFENLEGLSWETFFEQVDKLYLNTEEEDVETEEKEEQEVAFSGVATLPHDKAVCYGVCTVSKVPKLVKCEDCSLVVKMVGFGHHRKFRHKESRLLTRQSIKDADDSSNSDSNDDCQDFLLSPPHHHHHLSVASTSESCIFENQWRMTHPLETSSTSVSSPPQKHTTRINKQQPPPKNEAPRLYGVEKWNDLRLVLKRTPEKPSTDPKQNTDANNHHHLNQNVQEKQQNPPEQVLLKKSRRKPSSKAVCSKKKRKKKANRREKDLEQEANEEEDSPISERIVYQPAINDLQECDTFTDDAELDDDNSSFVTIPSQLTPSNDDSFVTIPTQLTPSTAACFWDPRESAGRPDAVKGTFKKTPLTNRLTSNSVPIKKTMLNLSVRPTSSSLFATTLEIGKKDANLDKIAGPSILKRPGQIMSPSQQQQHHRNEEKNSSFQQVYNNNKYSFNNMSTNYNQKQSEKEHSQNQILLQNQFSKMQQQMQKRRVLTRDFDAIIPRSSSSSNRKPPLITEDDVNNPTDSQPSHSPSSDTSSSTSNIYTDTQDNLTGSKKSCDLTSHSSSHHLYKLTPNNVVATQTEEEFHSKNKFVVHDVEERRFSSSKIQNDKNTSSLQKTPTTMFRMFRRSSPPQNDNDGKTVIMKSNVKTNIHWKGTTENLSNSPLTTPQQRKISTASTYSGRSHHYITPSGTRFVPVDPRGLVTLQKNSASNSITSSKSNSPIAATIPSTPSPASYTNSPSRSELINSTTNVVDVMTSRENNQQKNNSFVDGNYEQQQQCTPKTINNNNINVIRRQQQQHFSPPTNNQTTILNNSNFFRKRQFMEELPSQVIINSSSTPTRYQQRIIPSTNAQQQQHNSSKRFRAFVPQETDHQKYACIDAFSPDTRINPSYRVRTIFPQKQNTSNISVSPIPGSSTTGIVAETQQQTSNQLQYNQNNQIINQQRIHLSSQNQQQHFSSPQYRQVFAPNRQQQHYYRQQPNLIMRNNNHQINRGLSTFNYFPKSLSSLSGQFALEHPQQQHHYTQRFHYEKQQQQSLFNSPTEDPPFNEYIIGSSSSAEQQRISSTGGLYEQAENSCGGINIIRSNSGRTDQQQQSLLPFSYASSLITCTTPPTIRRHPPPPSSISSSSSAGYNNNSQQQMLINNNNNTLQQNFVSSSNRFSSSQITRNNNNNIPLSIDYNIQKQQQQNHHYHHQRVVQTEYRPGIDIDSHVIDPPPVLEAEGRLSSMEILQPVIYNNNRQLGVVCSNETVTSSTNLTPNKSNHSNEEDPGTRSSSASDLDLREIVHHNTSSQ